MLCVINHYLSLRYLSLLIIMLHFKSCMNLFLFYKPYQQQQQQQQQQQIV